MKTSFTIVLVASLMLFSILEISAYPAVWAREDYAWERSDRPKPDSEPQLTVSQGQTYEELPDHEFFHRERRELREIPNSEFSLHRVRRELGNLPSPHHNLIRRAKRQDFLSQLPPSPDYGNDYPTGPW